MGTTAVFSRQILTGLIPGAAILGLLDGYVGTTGEIGFLGFLDERIDGLPDPSGYAGRDGGLWRRTIDDFTVFSFYRDVLEQVTPQLRYIEADREAQVWVRIGDISSAQITPLLNRLGYRASRNTCLGNLRFLHSLNQQLRVASEDCQEVAERLLDAELECPLGGEYVHQSVTDGEGVWNSTALTARAEFPQDFQAPVVRWLRELKADIRLEPSRLSLHAEVEMVKQGGK